MNRRNALKMAGVAALAVTVGAEAEMAPAHMNRTEMQPKDPKNLDKGELKHTPLITVKEKDEKGYTLVQINVGQGGINHPSTPDHWIDFIELYANDKRVGKNILEAEISRGATTFSVKLDGVRVLKARAGCNLHGIWTSTYNL
jgi:superoxide reductase